MTDAATQLRLARRGLAALVWLYLLLVIVVWALMRLTGDWCWLGTLLIFGPRWIYMVPLPILAAPTLVLHPRMLLVLAVAGLIVMMPIMGFEFVLRRDPVGDVTALRVITCNLAKSAFNREAFLELIEQARPDVVAMQEYDWRTRLTFPSGWYVQERDEFLLASRYPIVDYAVAKRPFPNHWGGIDTSAVRYVLALPAGNMAVYNVHLQTPREGLAAVYSPGHGFRFSGIQYLRTEIEQRARESQADSQWIAQFNEPAIILGDFNMPVDSSIYRRWWSSYANAFSAVGLGFGYSKFNHEGRVNYGARIDQILYGPRWCCRDCWVSRDVGSDHRPVIADLVEVR